MVVNWSSVGREVGCKYDTVQNWIKLVKNTSKDREEFEDWLEKEAEKAKQKWLNKQGMKQIKDDGRTYDVEILHGKFQEVCNQFDNESIDHIITDPPYPAEYLQEWSDLSRIASRILRPSGFCICYSGKYHLPEYISRLSEYLQYYWQAILLHSGPPAGVHPVKINTRYKPILIFQKPPRIPQEEYISDLIQGTGREKDKHGWQQAEEEMEEIIKRFTKAGEVILDPFAGSGTTGEALKKTGRKYILIDDGENYV